LRERKEQYRGSAGKEIAETEGYTDECGREERNRERERERERERQRVVGGGGEAGNVGGEAGDAEAESERGDDRTRCSLRH